MKRVLIILVLAFTAFMCNQPKEDFPLKQNWLMYVGYNPVQNTPFLAYLQNDSINQNQFFILVVQDTIKVDPPKWNILIGQPNNVVRLATVQTESEFKAWHYKLTGTTLELPK